MDIELEKILSNCQSIKASELRHAFVMDDIINILNVDYQIDTGETDLYSIVVMPGTINVYKFYNSHWHSSCPEICPLPKDFKSYSIKDNLDFLEYIKLSLI